MDSGSNLPTFLTGDGSVTIFDRLTGEHYHSVFGAITESTHIFIKNGICHCNKEDISIIEVGFGSGLNVFLTLIEAEITGKSIIYHSTEKYPISRELAGKLNYTSFFDEKYADYFNTIHEIPWDTEVQITDHFTLKKIFGDVTCMRFTKKYDVVYFDAFSPEKQQELWTEEMFRKIFNTMSEGGVLSTYCAKGNVKRAMKKAGFQTFIVPGPPGKRHIVRAIKP